MSLADIPREQYHETLRALRTRCYRAILSIGAQPPVASLGFPKAWAVGEMVREARDAYGYTRERRRFKPTPKDLDDMIPVLGAIAQHKHEDIHGERDYMIIFSRAYDLPWHVIRDKLRTTAGERSLQRWQDRAVEKIINQRLTQMSGISHKCMRT